MTRPGWDRTVKSSDLPVTGVPGFTSFPAYTSGLGGGGGSNNAETLAWQAKVEADDGETLESAVVAVHDQLITDLKNAGYWDLIDGIAPIAAGRTAAGAMNALKGPDPVLTIGTGSADYVRGDGVLSYSSNNYNTIDTGIDSTNYTSDNFLIAVYGPVFSWLGFGSDSLWIGDQSTGNGMRRLTQTSINTRVAVNFNNLETVNSLGNTAPLFYAMGRDNTSTARARSHGVAAKTIGRGVTAGTTGNYVVYRGQTGARASVYVVGRFIEPDNLAPIIEAYQAALTAALA